MFRHMTPARDPKQRFLLEPWNSGILESWQLGILESRELGTLEFWNLGILGAWTLGILETWNLGTWEAWNLGILVAELPLEAPLALLGALWALLEALLGSPWRLQGSPGHPWESSLGSLSC